MLKYKELNVNPKKRKTGDCSTRAIVTCLGISYDEALELQFKETREKYYDPMSRRVMEAVLAKYGYSKKPQPRKANGLKYPVYQMDAVLTEEEKKNGVVLNVAHHYVAVKGDEYVDIWDSGFKYVGNYYSKG